MTIRHEKAHWQDDVGRTGIVTVQTEDGHIVESVVPGSVEEMANVERDGEFFDVKKSELRLVDTSDPDKVVTPPTNYHRLQV